MSLFHAIGGMLGAADDAASFTYKKRGRIVYIEYLLQCIGASKAQDSKELSVYSCYEFMNICRYFV